MDSHVSASNGSNPRGTLRTIQFDSSVHKHKNSNGTITTTTTALSSIRYRCYKYFQQKKTVKSIRRESLSTIERQHIIHEVTRTQENSIEYCHPINRKRRSNTVVQGMAPNFITPTAVSPSSLLMTRRYLSRPTNTTTTTTTTTTPTSTNGTLKEQKRPSNVVIENNQLKNDSIMNEDDEQQQQLARACMKTYRLSLPTIRYESCYYYQRTLPLQSIIAKATIEEQNKTVTNDQKGNQSRKNSVTTEQSPSQGTSSADCPGSGSGTAKAVNPSRHNSSFDITMDEENGPPVYRNRPLGCSKPRSPSRYSQRAIAEFMHERRKACLRRNQKASRMLGMKKNHLVEIEVFKPEAKDLNKNLIKIYKCLVNF